MLTSRAMNARSHRNLLFSAAVAVVILASSVACGEESRRGEAPRQAAEEGQVVGRGETIGGGETTEGTMAEAVEVGMELCEGGREEIRIGSFERPEDVPPYETLEEERADRGCVEAVRLLVDTQADDREGYALITRDLKAEYAELDAVTVEFTDTSGTFAYDGGALIFNTPSGAYFMGYAYGPPNNEGYYVAISE